MKDWAIVVLALLLGLVTLGININTAWQFHLLHKEFEREYRLLEARPR